MQADTLRVLRAGDLVITGGAEGRLPKQIAEIEAALERMGARIADLCLLRALYRPEAISPETIRTGLARALAGRAVVALTLVPVGFAGVGDGALSIEAMAVAGAAGSEYRTVPMGQGEGCFARGVRKGRFLFLGAQTAAGHGGIVVESREVMVALGETLAALGAGFGDVVRMNRWYHGAGTQDDWEPSARAVAAFYTEPGPIATAISLPVALEGGFAIQIELMGMIGTDGQTLPKSHSWPEGHWDWPVHLPYKHGLACDGLGFVGGQVSIDAEARVLDAERLDLQVIRSLNNIDLVIAGFGAATHRILHFGAYYEIPPAGLSPSTRDGQGLLAIAHDHCPSILAGFAYLSYPDMRAEIEAIVELG